MNTLFHLAFPVHDFELAKQFYCDKLGCQLGRESDHALILQFGSNQIVAHKVDSIPQEQEGIYPRHFGLIFLEQDEYHAFRQKITDKHLSFAQPFKVRFPNTQIEHGSFFLKDPSNNLIEFKYYTHFSAVFGEREYKKIGDK